MKLTKEQAARIQEERKAAKDMFEALGRQLVTNRSNNFSYNKNGAMVIDISPGITIDLDDKKQWSLV